MKRKASTLLGALLHSEIARPYATYDSRNSYLIYVEPSVSLARLAVAADCEDQLCIAAWMARAT